LTGTLSEWFKNHRQFSPQEQKLLSYIELLISEKKVRNIVGASNKNEIIDRHILPSLQLGLLISEKKGVDVGTGAGLPGLPAAIVFQDKEVTLIEPKISRVSFLKKVKNELQLNNISVVRERAEKAGHVKKYRESFGFALCRAVSSLKVTAELVIPFLEINGKYYAQVGRSIEEELKLASASILQMGAVVKEIAGDTAVIIKERSTPENFPRSWNKIKASDK